MELADSNLRIQRRLINQKRVPTKTISTVIFWSEFLGELELDDVTQSVPKSAKAQNLFWSAAEFFPRLDQRLLRGEHERGRGFTWATGKTEFEIAYRELERDKDAIMAELPDSAVWGLMRGTACLSVCQSVTFGRRRTDNGSRNSSPKMLTFSPCFPQEDAGDCGQF